MTASEAAKLVAMLLNAYPQAQFGAASSAMYERLLADLDVGAAVAAVERIIQTSKWLPTIAEIRAAALDVRQGPKRLGAEAWGDVNEAVRRVGRYRAPPAFTDPLVAECVRQFGWLSLCDSTNDPADRARFIELYDGLQDRERADQQATRRLPAPRAAGALPWAAPKLRALPAPSGPSPAADAVVAILAQAGGRP